MDVLKTIHKKISNQKMKSKERDKSILIDPQRERGKRDKSRRERARENDRKKDRVGEKQIGREP